MPEDSADELTQWLYFDSEEEKRQVFEPLKGAILEEWIRQRPGTRPRWWWSTSAPEKAARRRLGGIGDAAHKHLADVETYDRGIPTRFIHRSEVEYYNGRARDIHGKIINSGYSEGHFAGRAIDPKNPPRYESQAAYLKRHGLLTDAEKRRLRRDDFEPEFVLPGKVES